MAMVLPYRLVAPELGPPIPAVSVAPLHSINNCILNPPEGTKTDSDVKPATDRPVRKRKKPDFLSEQEVVLQPKARKQQQQKEEASNKPEDPIVIRPSIPAMPFRMLLPPCGDRTVAAPTVAIALKTDIMEYLEEVVEERRQEAIKQRQSDAVVVVKVTQGQQGKSGKANKSKQSKEVPKGREARESPSTKQQGISAKDKEKSGQGKNPKPVPANSGPKPSRQISEVKFRREPGDVIDRSAVVTHTWATGMTCIQGINFVDMSSTAGGPLPTVVVGKPPRWPAPTGRKTVAKVEDHEEAVDEGYSELSTAQPVLTAVQYVKYMARSVGRLPYMTPAAQQAFNNHQRLNRTRLARSFFARDGRLIDCSTHPAGARRSTRIRSNPIVFKPTMEGGKAANKGSSGNLVRDERVSRVEFDEEVDPSDLTDVRVGAEFQCVLPAYRARPPAPTSREERFGGTLVVGPCDMIAEQQKQKKDIAGVENKKERAALISAACSALAESLGTDRASNFGLGTMGASAKSLLSTQEQKALRAGMHKYGREFHTIAKELIPTKTAMDLASFYYDVWKLKLTPQAEAWYGDKAAEEAKRQAALVELERHREIEQARRLERQEANNRRRQMREAVSWLRAAARSMPTDVNFNKPVVMERASRVVGCRVKPNGQPKK